MNIINQRCIDAIEDGSFPCNPIPFANALAALVRERGTDSIKSRDAQRILWILISQSYGQLAVVDTIEEWSRLTSASNEMDGTSGSISDEIKL